MCEDDFPIFKKKSNRKLSDKLERKTAKRFGLKQQPNSGATDWRKGDFVYRTNDYRLDEVKKGIQNRKFIGDQKSSKFGSIKITIEMVDKLKTDVADENADDWFIPIILKDKLLGVMISPDLFEEIFGKV